MSNQGLPFTLSNRAITRERLVTALIFALLAHGVILLGVGFVSLVPKAPKNPMVEVTLVRDTHVTPPPRRMDYLAQANQRGPGNRRRLDAPIPALGSGDPFPHPGVRLDSAFRTSLPAQPVPSSAPSDADRHQSRAPEDVITSANGATPVARQNRATPQRPPLITRLVPPSQAASLDQDHLPIVTLPKIKGRNPRRNATTTNARASVYAPYLEAWRSRIEVVGHEHYNALVPTRIKNGHVTLSITLNADGSIQSIQIVHHSRYPVLDAAALKIIRLAAPFPPFPPAVRKRTDQLSFSYQWNFIRGRISTGRIGSRS